MIDYSLVCKNLKDLRQSKKLSQSALSELLESHGVHCTRQRLSRLEDAQDGSLITLDLLSAYCDIFDVDLAYITGESALPTRTVQDLIDRLGLPRDAVLYLLHCENKDILSAILSHKTLDDIVTRLDTCIRATKMYQEVLEDDLTDFIKRCQKKYTKDTMDAIHYRLSVLSTNIYNDIINQLKEKDRD